MGLKGVLPLCLFVCLSAFIFLVVQEKVTSPFIDEIFHLRQCQKYCQYKFQEWDNKITTPPGLYVIGFVWANLVNYIGTAEAKLDEVCQQYWVLRSVNLVGGTLVIPWLALKLQKNLALFQENYWPVNIAAIPLIFPYYFIFYTDIWSTILSISCVLVALTRTSRPFLISTASALIGLISLTLRQTNILWAGFAMCLIIEKEEAKKGRRNGRGFNLIRFASLALGQWKLCCPFALILALFAVFIKVNGGITLGDSENHVITIHLAQVLYCSLFITSLTWPIWLSTNHLKNYLKWTVTGNQFKNLIGTMVSFYLIKYVIDHYSIAHPFLLADNRHITFYLWKRLFSIKNSFYLMVPVYHFSIWTIITTLLNSKVLSPVTVFVYLAVSCLGLIPSPLFEPRYYIIPLVIFRIFTCPTDKKLLGFTVQRHLLEFIWQMSINFILMALFLLREFEWPSEPGKIQRIIW